MQLAIITFVLALVSLFAPAQSAQRGFITVEGADLRSKFETAVKMGRGAQARIRFWVAYSFDVRPGVAVDPEVGEFHGSMSSYGDTTVFFGKSNGASVETRNLG